LGSELVRVSTDRSGSQAVLRVLADDISLGDRDAFMRGCQELLATQCSRLVIDFGRIERVFSIFVGTVMDVNARAHGEGRELEVLAGPGVTRLFRMVAPPEALKISPRKEAG
jgi:hypothetical protein